MAKTRNTVGKLKVQELLMHSDVALSQSELHKELEGLCDRVTTYRILDRMVENGEVHRIINIDGVIKYALCHSCKHKHQHNHVHFSCVKCNEVTCLEGVVPHFQIPKDYQVEEVNFTLSGRCPKCVSAA